MATTISWNPGGWDSTSSTDSYRVSTYANSSSGRGISISGNSFTRAGPGCNESSKFNNDEKALYHGLKSAFRMSRTYDGREYGTDEPPYDIAARIAANVAVAYLTVTGQTYRRAESFDYIESEIMDDASILQRLRRAFDGEVDYPEHGPATTEELSDGLDRAWEQIDEKHHHYDAARTALAIAEAHLNERFDVPVPGGNTT